MVWRRDPGRRAERKGSNQGSPWRGVVSGVLLGSWAGLVVLWVKLAGQLVALREGITKQAGMGALLTRALPVWGKGTL